MRLVSCNQLYDLLGTDFDFDRAVRHFNPSGRHSGGRFPVKMDLVRENGTFKILAELPGMEKDKIRIMVENGILTIGGERIRGENKDNEVVRSERFFGSFTRSFKLPDTIEKSGISADYKNGLLEVTLPVKEEEKPKQIEVTVN
jgi:HSP20 family protein